MVLGDINMKKKKVCPSCGSPRVAEIMYGYPNFNNEELMKKLENEEVYLGGCCIIFDMTQKIVQGDYHCFNCEKDFDSRTKKMISNDDD
jgi:DNA-directed RNA polymerase subunit RPC12/RpoP